MAITYTWELTGLKKRTSGALNDVIFQTYWKKIGTDENGNTGTFSGATPFDPAQVDPNNFVPFDELTADIVLGWIQGVVVGQYEQHVNAQIQKEINLKSSPIEEVQAGNFPWDPPTPPVPPVTP